MCNLCSLPWPGQTGPVQSNPQPHGSRPLSDSPGCVPNVCAGLLSHVVAYLFKTAMSPNKSNSCSFRDVSIMTSVFCLHLHHQRGERETQKAIQRTAVAWCGFCVGAAALEARNSGASDETVSGRNKRS